MTEIDERMRNWRTDRITEYAKLEKKIIIERNELLSDPEINKLALERDKLDKLIIEKGKQHILNIDAAQQQQTGIKLELVDRWYGEEKTFVCPAGTATLRTTKSLKIQSKEKLIDFLVLNKKLVDFIKSFEITKLRKIKDAGMLEDEVATYDEKKSVAIKITEAEQ